MAPTLSPSRGSRAWDTVPEEMGQGKGGGGELSAVSQDHGSGECRLGTQHTSKAAHGVLAHRGAGFPPVKGHIGACRQWRSQDSMR